MWNEIKENNKKFAEYREERHKEERFQVIEVVEENIDNIALMHFPDESYDKNADEEFRFQLFKENIKEEYGKKIPNCQNLSLVHEEKGNEKSIQMEFKTNIDDKTAYTKLNNDVYRGFVYKNSSGNISVYNVTELEAKQYGEIEENSYRCKLTISKDNELTTQLQQQGGLKQLKKPPVQQQYQK